MGLLDRLRLPDAPTLEHLDTAEGVRARSRLIHAQRLLNLFYRFCYTQLVDRARDYPEGARIEIGSGGGFLREYVPGLIETDIMESSAPRVACSGTGLPFRSTSLSCIYALNVVHHIPDPEAFFREAIRTTKPGGGLVLVEPANTPLSSFVYRNFHHEEFDPTAGWKLEAGGGPMSTSNQAVPWILFFRDRAEFERKFPELKIRSIELHSGLLYILSGGFSLRQLAPTAFGPLLLWLERNLGPLQRLLGLFMTVRIDRV